MDELKSTGLKTTIPRQKILEIFQKGVQRHMTAEDVFKHLLNDNADIGLATVYRVLTQFEQAGLLSRSHFESGKAVYELNEGQHHDHMVCLECGRTDEFHDPRIEELQAEAGARKGYELVSHDHRQQSADCDQHAPQDGGQDLFIHNDTIKYWFR